MAQKLKTPLFVSRFLARVLSWLKITGLEEFDHPSKGRGVMYQGQEFVHHTSLPHRESALYNFSYLQKLFLIISILVLAGIFLLSWRTTILVGFALLTFMYFVDLCFSAYLIYRSFSQNPEIQISSAELASLKDSSLPMYTIFCPLYKEWQVVPQFVAAMEKMDYPKSKLQVMFLLEEDDQETVQKISEQKLPKHFQIVVVPHSKPKTKPKAMNYGLQFATGEIIAIYDAEDKPESTQLKKAVLAFEKSGPRTFCVQAKLNFYNPNQNLLTRLFTAEYSLWFDLVLPGLQSLRAPIPLGGTSNHFHARDIRKLHGWDAFNVTEDCDLGMRLAKRGYKTAIVDSTTYEEANSDWLNWFRQRSRWIKGYIQTYFVHMRRPKDFLETGRPFNLFAFQIIVGGKILSMFINPLMWLVTATYFLFRAQAAPYIEPFFPGPILYTGVVCFVFGNFMFLYTYMIGLSKRRLDGLVKYALLVPVYWLGMSFAATKAVYEVFVKPHYWAKTVHGLHLEKQAVMEDIPNAWSLKKLLTKNVAGGSFLVVAMLFANFFNFLTSAYLGRTLRFEDFGLITLFNTLTLVVSIFISALASTVNHRTAYIQSKEGLASSAAFLRRVSKYANTAALGFSILWIIAAPLSAAFFKVDAPWLLLAFLPVLAFGFMAAHKRGFLQGSLNFKFLGLVVAIEALVKFLSAATLARLGFGSLTALSLPISITMAWLLASWFTSRVIAEIDPAEPVKTFRFPKRFMGASVLTGLSTTAFLTLDVLLAKHYLSAADAGAYALLSLTGNIIYFLGSLLSVFIVTYVSKYEGEGKNSTQVFYWILGGMSLMVGGAYVGLGLLGHIFVPLLFGNKARAIVPYLPIYTAALALFTLATAFVSYHLARKHYVFSLWSLVMASTMGLGIMLRHNSILSIAKVMLAVSVLNLVAVVVLHALQKNGQFILRNVVDLLDAFFPLPKDTRALSGKRILVFNWRDTKHAFAGGAEIYIHELSRRWVERGNAVTLFCGNDGKSERYEIVDGVRVVRRGGFYTVYLWAFVYYFTQFRGRFDVIVDCQNGVPFFTPFYAKEKVVAVLHHIHQEVFYKFLPKPLAFVAAVLENRIMPWIYNHTRFITVSESSKAEMQRWGIGQAGIDVVYPGVDLELLEPGEKHNHPVVLYLGRLKAYKAVHVLIQAFWYIAAQIQTAKLIIAGDGEERAALEQLVDTLGMSKYVIFTGKVSEDEKLELLQKSWVFCNPSMMEGWGITSIEANACGTPVVASNVPGLRESVQNPHTGYLVEHGNVEKFAEKIHAIIGDKELQKFMRQESLMWAQNFSWEKSAEKSLEIINAE